MGSQDQLNTGLGRGDAAKFDPIAAAAHLNREEQTMRTLIGYCALALATMTVGAMPANAKWTCEGPEYVCGSARAAAPSASKVSYKKSKKTYSPAQERKPFVILPN